MKTNRSNAAFTLLELLTVIAIIGILAAITVPNLHTFKPNTMAAASSQLLADVGRARQLAISHRTTVYMVFVPSNYWADATFTSAWRTTNDWPAATNLFDKQLVGDWLLSVKWDKSPPAPDLPADVIAGTRERYLEILRILSGRGLNE